MAEWSKAHAWKVCKLQKGFMGSNPILSAFLPADRQAPTEVSSRYPVPISRIIGTGYRDEGRLYYHLNVIYRYCPIKIFLKFQNG